MLLSGGVSNLSVCIFVVGFFIAAAWFCAIEIIDERFRWILLISGLIVNILLMIYTKHWKNLPIGFAIGIFVGIGGAVGREITLAIEQVLDEIGFMNLVFSVTLFLSFVFYLIELVFPGMVLFG